MRRALITPIALALAAGLAGGVAMVAAQASPSASRSALVNDTETIRIITAHPAAREVSTLATGHFTGGGYSVPGKLNPTTLRATAKVVFQHGTFHVNEHVTSQHVSLPTAQCLVSETIHGTYTLGAGTGIYKNIAGHGQYVTGINAVVTRSNGKCGGAFVVFQEITTARGPARL